MKRNDSDSPLSRDGKKLPAYQRKNPRSAELEQRRRQEKNSTRPKQMFVPGEGWVR